jgi:glutamate dehydrogenase (NADP+)
VGKRCLVSGSGNVAQHCAQKLMDEGALVLGMSDSRGYIFERDGLTREQLAQISAIKESHSGQLEQYRSPTAVFVQGRRVWEVDGPIDAAFPCATQHELDLEDAQQLVQHGCKFVFEGANMPCTPRAVRCFEEHGVVFSPAKAVNAGGVAVSGLEMTQDRLGMQWSEEEVDAKLRAIMHSIYRTCKETAEEYHTTLAAAANIAGFLRVAEAQRAQGAV